MTPKHVDELISIFECDIFPFIVNELMRKIKPQEMLTVFKL